MRFKSNTIRINILLIIGVALLFCAFIVKVGYVALSDNVEGTDLELLASTRSTATKKITAKRGTIYDNSGEVLAQNTNSYTVIAYLSSSRTTDESNPKHVVDKETTAKALDEILYPDQDKYQYILNLLNTEGAYQVELGPGGKAISEATKEKIKALNLPGIDFVQSSKRYYPYGDFASYIIGYAKKYIDEETNDESFVGELGIEQYCDRYLKGTDGSITYQKDAYGYQMADTLSYIEEAKDGYDIYLTLDKQVQMFLDDAIDRLDEYEPSWTIIAVADADTGAIIGSATSPSFNPNTLDIEDYNNPLLSYTYEPGSTMKIFSFMSAMEEGLYDGSSTYLSGKITVDEYEISDWYKYGWGTITYDVGFTYSSNVAAVNLAQRLGKAKLYDYYSKLGFGSKTDIELANEYVGDIDFEYASEVASASYGQGVTVTPIQMIQALTTITNDGTLLKPYIISKIVDTNTGKTVYEGGRKEIRKIYSSDTINKMIELLDATVNGTDSTITGKWYHTDAVRVIGKTGTANYTNQYGYVEGDRYVIRSFAGVFPKEDPEYIIYFATKDVNASNKQIGEVITDLIESVAKYKNLDERENDKDETKIVTIPNLLSKSIQYANSTLTSLGINPIIIGDGGTVVETYPEKDTVTSINSKLFILTNGSNITMPDMTNWSSKDLIAFCNLIGLKYNLSGYGYVSSTSIATGTTIDVDSMTLDATLVNIEPETLVDEVVSNE